jgi:imidazolonepropionase-like amidohydrolase
MEIAPEHAIAWITSNAAKSLGVESETGSLEAGKMADVVLWNGNPFSVYAKADHVYIDGALVYDREDPDRQPVSDFELGQQQGVLK